MQQHSSDHHPIFEEDIATSVGDLSRAMEEGFYLMASELEDVEQSRAKVRDEISSATQQLLELEAEIGRVQSERDDACMRSQAYASVTRSMKEREEYLLCVKDGLLVDDTEG